MAEETTIYPSNNEREDSHDFLDSCNDTDGKLRDKANIPTQTEW